MAAADHHGDEIGQQQPWSAPIVKIKAAGRTRGGGGGRGEGGGVGGGGVWRGHLLHCGAGLTVWASSVLSARCW